MTNDPYQNIYYYYRGPQRERLIKGQISFDVQLENNTTKALINTLIYCKPEICLNFLKQMLKRKITDINFNYLLQVKTIGAEKIKSRKERILWVICSSGICPKEIDLSKVEIIPSSADSSLPDAWIWNGEAVILIESKTRSKIELDQLKRHIRLLEFDSVLIVSYWEEIHDYFDGLIKNDKNIIGVDLFLIKQFTKYLELVSLSSFNGWNDEDFDFFFLYEKDKDEIERMKTKMQQFVSEVLNDKKLSDLLEDKGTGTLRYPPTNIWHQLDIRDNRFFINLTDRYLNFTMELFPTAFQVTIVFPVFSSIDKLREVLKIKKYEITTRLKEVLQEKIIKTGSHTYLAEALNNKDIIIDSLPQYKIRLYDHASFKPGNRHWIPKAELTIDPQTLNGNYWYDFLEDLINLYHPPRPPRESYWGAGLHILKEYPRGSGIVSQPKELIEDVRSTLQDFLKIVDILV